STQESRRSLTDAAPMTKSQTDHEVVIISGLAEGFDTVAHETAISEGGKTIAVLGTPLNRTYPQRNLQLQNKIMKNYLAISQFPIGYPIQRKNFVIRNSTMALISNASI